MSTNPFQQLLDLGYTRLTPIIPPDAPISERSNLFKRIQKGDDARGKVPGVKWNDGTWSGFDFVANETVEAERWYAMGANVGIKTGRGLVLIDADTKNQDRAKIIRDTIWSSVGPLPVRIGEYPKAGYLVRTDEDFQYTRIEFGERDDKGRLKERVEILSEGRQFVAIGEHPVTRKPYRWPQPIPRYEDISFISSERLVALLAELRPLLPSASEVIREGAVTDVEQESLRGDIALIRQAVKATPNSSNMFPSRESYRDYGYAIKAAAGPEHEAEAFELFANWCARWSGGDNEPEIVAADWARMKPPFRRGANWLYELAEEYGDAEQFPPGTALIAKWFENVEAPLSGEILPNLFDKKARKYDFLSFDQAADAALTSSTEPLIKGLLDQGAMTVLYGPSNVGKTFIAMDLAYHIAAGVDYAGMRTTQGCVIYVAAEGGRGAKRRVRALRDRYAPGNGDSVQFLLLASPVDLRRPDADLKPLISAIQALSVPVKLIVIDTLSRAMAGGDENSSVDMGYIVNHFDVLRSVTTAHLMVVHHSGKNAAQGARGHSLLRAATDTEIEVGEGVVAVTKQRDLDRSWASGFALETVVLGVDGEGDPVTSCTVRLSGRVGVAVAGLTPKEAEVGAAVEALEGFNTGENEGVSVADLVEFFDAKQDNLSENAVRQMLKRLVAKGRLTKCLRGRWKTLVVKSGQESGQGVFE